MRPPPARPEPPIALRWLALALLSAAMAANYYIYDSVNTVADVLRSGLGFQDHEIGWFQTGYSISALLTLFFAGVFIDRFGTRLSLGVFSVLCFAGALLTAARGSFAWMVSGRVVLGLGAESLIVAVTTALAKWFRGKELGFAFGANLTIARLASVAADNSPRWASFAFYPGGPEGPPSWQGPLLVAAAAGALGVVAAFAYARAERTAERRYALGKAGETDRLEFSELVRFSAPYWCIVGLCATFYSTIFPFRTFAVKFLMDTHFASLPEDGAREAGGTLNGLLPLAAMVATPLFGLLLDKLGRRATFMAAGTLLFFPAFPLLATGAGGVWLPFVLLGVAFSLIPAAMWPSVAYIVEERRLGSAYALMTLIQQIGMAGMNWGLGRLNSGCDAGPKNPAGYAPGMWLLSALALLAVVFALLLLRAARSPSGRGLETPASRPGAAG
ncbi:MAG: MFS transporter [Planctomycetota bacterium]